MGTKWQHSSALGAKSLSSEIGLPANWALHVLICPRQAERPLPGTIHEQLFKRNYRIAQLTVNNGA
jgi:hypothetical protein